MEDILVIFTQRYYSDSECITEFATSATIPHSVYIALLTGGESAIRSYYLGNIGGDPDTIRSVTMRNARIEDRGQIFKIQSHHKDTFTYEISPTGDVYGHFSYDHSTLKLKVRKNPKQLVKICYDYLYKAAIDTLCTKWTSRTVYMEDVYAAYDDGSYEQVGSVCTRNG